MLNLPQKTFNKIKEKLTKQKAQIEEELVDIDKTDPALSDIPESTEPGTASWMADAHGAAVGMKDNLMKLLSNTVKALDKLRKGSYGKCENCGKEIEASRLEALPTATLCLACSKKLNRA